MFQSSFILFRPSLVYQPQNDGYGRPELNFSSQYLTPFIFHFTNWLYHFTYISGWYIPLHFCLQLLLPGHLYTAVITERLSNWLISVKHAILKKANNEKFELTSSK